MTQRLAKTASALLLCLPFFTGTSRADAPMSYLVITPSQGHSGDTFYISGAGFPPRTHLYIIMACPSLFDNSARVYGNYKVQLDGPTTDNNGQFLAYPFQAVQLHGARSLSCQIYTPDEANPMGPDFPGLYYIYPPGSSIPASQRHMHVSVAVSPARVHAGYAERITLSNGWPGAHAAVTVTYPGQPLQRYSATFNIHRRASLPIRVPQHVAPAVQAQVRVNTHLGNEDATAANHFIVVR